MIKEDVPQNTRGQTSEKDFREKKLEDFDDVFCDIINVLLFDGEHRVDEEELESGMPRSSYKIDGKFEEQERDVKKFWKRGQVRLAVYGMENQTGEDPDFIFRNFGYDGAEYRDQVRRRNEIRRKNTKLRKEGVDDSRLESVPDFYPVVTLVLYFGETHWKSSLNLKDHLKIPEGLEEYVTDYKVNLFEIAYLSEKQVSSFQSDFRFVAEYFVATRKKKEGVEPTFTIGLEHLKHVEEFIELMNAITNSDRFSRLPKLINERGENTMMTILFDEAEARGQARGEAIGQTRGEAIGEARGQARGEAIGEARGQARGEAIGQARGEVMGAIRIYATEMHLSPSEIVQKIMTRFSFEQEEAEQFVSSVLNQEKK